MRSLAQQHAESTMILRVGRTVVYALAKQLNKEWDQKALETASSPESLSMAADDFGDAMQNVRRAISTTLRTVRVRGRERGVAIRRDLIRALSKNGLFRRAFRRAGPVGS